MLSNGVPAGSGWVERGKERKRKRETEKDERGARDGCIETRGQRLPSSFGSDLQVPLSFFPPHQVIIQSRNRVTCTAQRDDPNPAAHIYKHTHSDSARLVYQTENG